MYQNQSYLYRSRSPLLNVGRTKSPPRYLYTRRSKSPPTHTLRREHLPSFITNRSPQLYSRRNDVSQTLQRRKSRSRSPQPHLRTRSPPIFSRRNRSPQHNLRSPSPQHYLRSPSPQHYLRSPSPQHYLRSPPSQHYLRSPSPQKSESPPLYQRISRSPSPNMRFNPPSNDQAGNEPLSYYWEMENQKDPPENHYNNSQDHYNDEHQFSNSLSSDMDTTRFADERSNSDIGDFRETYQHSHSRSNPNFQQAPTNFKFQDSKIRFEGKSLEEIDNMNADQVRSCYISGCSRRRIKMLANQGIPYIEAKRIVIKESFLRDLNQLKTDFDEGCTSNSTQVSEKTKLQFADGASNSHSRNFKETDQHSPSHSIASFQQEPSDFKFQGRKIKFEIHYLEEIDSMDSDQIHHFRISKNFRKKLKALGEKGIPYIEAKRTIMKENFLRALKQPETSSNKRHTSSSTQVSKGTILEFNDGASNSDSRDFAKTLQHSLARPSPSFQQEPTGFKFLWPKIIFKIHSLEEIDSMNSDQINNFSISGASKKRLKILEEKGIPYIEAKRTIIKENYLKALKQLKGASTQVSKETTLAFADAASNSDSRDSMETDQPSPSRSSPTFHQESSDFKFQGPRIKFKIHSLEEIDSMDSEQIHHFSISGASKKKLKTLGEKGIPYIEAKRIIMKENFVRALKQQKEDSNKGNTSSSTQVSKEATLQFTDGTSNSDSRDSKGTDQPSRSSPSFQQEPTDFKFRGSRIKFKIHSLEEIDSMDSEQIHCFSISGSGKKKLKTLGEKGIPYIEAKRTIMKENFVRALKQQKKDSNKGNTSSSTQVSKEATLQFTDGASNSDSRDFKKTDQHCLSRLSPSFQQGPTGSKFLWPKIIFKIHSLEEVDSMNSEQINHFSISGASKKRLKTLEEKGIPYIEAKRTIIKENFLRALKQLKGSSTQVSKETTLAFADGASNSNSRDSMEIDQPSPSRSSPTFHQESSDFKFHGPRVKFNIHSLEEIDRMDSEHIHHFSISGASKKKLKTLGEKGIPYIAAKRMIMKENFVRALKQQKKDSNKGNTSSSTQVSKDTTLQFADEGSNSEIGDCEETDRVDHKKLTFRGPQIKFEIKSCEEIDKLTPDQIHRFRISGASKKKIRALEHKGTSHIEAKRIVMKENFLRTQNQIKTDSDKGSISNSA